MKGRVRGAVLGILGAKALALAGMAIFTARTARRVERALPPAGRFIDVEGSRLHYIDRGSGPAIVMIHGLAGSSANFTHSLVDLLAGDFRVVVLDRPGAGYSVRPRGAPAELPAQARVVAGLIAALELDRPLVVGHSLGGAIALALALDYPHLVRGLALVAPFTRPGNGVPAPFRGLWIRSPFVRALVAHTVAVPLSIAGAKRAIAAVFAPEEPPHDFPTKGGGLLSLRPSAFIAASEDLIAAHNGIAALSARYRELTVPVSVLYGSDDAILDYELNGLSLRDDLPQAEVTLIPGGHMLPVTVALKTADWIVARA